MLEPREPASPSTPGVAEGCIHEAFSRHARSQPDLPALVWGRERISYRMLDTASDAYAARLAALGVGPGRIVPLLLPRSPRLVALQLAVLKCGAAYANVDPAWPADRQAAILAQTAAKVVVSGSRGPAGLADAGVQVLHVPAQGALPEDAPAERFEPAGVRDTEPSMVFFTSGTTGVPKGVVIPHRSVTRLFGPNGLPGFGPGHATPQAAALAWDMYAFELWGQLTSGGCAVLVEEEHLLPGSLRRFAASSGVTTVWLTTSLFNLFVDEDVDCFEGVRHLFIGGEKLSPAHVRAFLARHPDIPVHNGYGPVENCMLATTHAIRPGDCEVPEGIPVGVPVPGTEVLILSPADTRCETGEIGEVCVAGTGLATAYLNQPGLTAEKFSTVELEGRAVRMYRTGDLGFLDEAGVLHFRGRRDRQVKISGLRIEPAEIEHAARALPGVRQCLVVPFGARGSENPTALALFYLADDPVPAGEADVEAALRRTLPAYLVPRVVRRLDRFPVTANGKADQAELTRLARDRRAARRAVA